MKVMKRAVASKTEYKVIHNVDTIELESVLNLHTEWWHEKDNENPWRVHQCTKMSDDFWTVVFEKRVYKYEVEKV